MTATLTSRIPEIIAGAEPRAELVVSKTTADIVAGCKVRSRVDTGEMREGWTWELLSPLESVAYNPVEHTLPNEFGTENMPAQPMLHPSVEEHREPFHRAIAEIYS